MNTWQTVYEQLQEIQEAVLKKVNYQEYRLYHDFIEKWNKSIVADNRYKLSLNKPISLSRVLSALGDDYCLFQWEIFETDWWSWMRDTICSRKLLNEDKSDCMLSDQSEDTIKAIWEIICK